MPRLVLPDSLARLFPGIPRVLEVTGDSVAICIADADAAWPGLRDRLCNTPDSWRPHILAFLDGEPCSPTSPIARCSEILVVPALSGG